MAPGEFRPADGRFGRERRLTTKSEFEQVFQKGRKTVRPSFVVYTLPRGGEGVESRLGCVISRRVGGAVARNRMRRLIREWFRVHRVEYTATTDLVVLVRAGSAARAAVELREELRLALIQAGILAS